MQSPIFFFLTAWATHPPLLHEGRMLQLRMAPAAVHSGLLQLLMKEHFFISPAQYSSTKLRVGAQSDIGDQRTGTASRAGISGAPSPEYVLRQASFVESAGCRIWLDEGLD
jgi:hypothetical protein